MSEIKVNKITPKQNCTQVTLGDSGDTFVIPSGVTITNNGTQTGFGRTGTVDWDTTAKTASFTAVSGNGYFVNTTSGAITVTLPASPSAGDIVAVADYAGTAATNNITIARNGSNIEGGTDDARIYENRDAITLVYVDGTQGWVPVNNNEKSGILPPAYVAATGGTITCCGDYKIHTFTGPGTFTVTCAGNPIGSNTVDYMVVAGGAGGGSDRGGGGGAGGFRESSGTASGCYTASPLGACVAALPVSAQPYPITVGGGGSPQPYLGGGQPDNNGNPGSNSIFSTITSTGGGGGGSGNGSGGATPVHAGLSGGSGGGATVANNTATFGGAGNTPPVSPAQGFRGGNTSASSGIGAAGGGGATASGTQATSNQGTAGGAGATTSISGSSTAYAGGGGGGNGPPAPPAGGAGGTGGGGRGDGSSTRSTNGTANTGGGGGGASNLSGCGPVGQGGGSGIVIIRYKFQ
jgi:hypothetical protein